MTDSPKCPQAPQSPTYHDPEGRRHPRKGMGVVRSDGWNPGTPEQGEEPRSVDSVEVYTQVPGCIVPGQGTEVGQLSLGALLHEAGGAPRQTVTLTATPGGRHVCVQAHRTSPALPSASRPTSKPCVFCPVPTCHRWRVKLGVHSPSLPPSGAPGVAQGRHLSSW